MSIKFELRIAGARMSFLPTITTSICNLRSHPTVVKGFGTASSSYRCLTSVTNTLVGQVSHQVRLPAGYRLLQLPAISSEPIVSEKA